MTLAIIVAHDDNLLIGAEGGLPWHIPEDLKHFKKKTMGHPILMGRGVFEEIDENPLPGRRNVVLSRSKEYEQVESYNSIDEALDALNDEELVYVIGGGTIYAQMLSQADILEVTEIHRTYEGDTCFPEYRDDIGEIWEEVEREDHEEYSFVTYRRK